MTETPPYRWDGEDLILELHVQPRAARDELGAIHGDRLKVRLQAPPVEGRANARLVRFLAEVFGVPRGRVELLAGAGGREKRVRVRRPTALPPPVRRAPG